MDKVLSGVSNFMLNEHGRVAKQYNEQNNGFVSSPLENKD